VNPISKNLSKAFENSIFIKNIPVSVNEQKIRLVFEEAPGDIVSIKLKTIFRQGAPQTEANAVMLHAYLLYKDNKTAQRCIQLHDNQLSFGSGSGHKPLSVDFWKTKDELKQEKAQQIDQNIQSLLQNIM